jgi:hypothetical protein
MVLLTGSVPEVLEEGRTGFIVKNLEDATEAINGVATLSRARCRRVFEKRFTATRMASDYVKVYMRMIERSVTGGDGSRPNHHGALSQPRRRYNPASPAKAKTQG